MSIGTLWQITKRKRRKKRRRKKKKKEEEGEDETLSTEKGLTLEQGHFFQSDRKKAENMAAAAGSLVGLFRRERSFRRFKQKGRNLLREKEVNLLGTVLRFESQGSCTLGTYDHLLYASPFGWQWKLEELVEKYSSED